VSRRPAVAADPYAYQVMGDKNKLPARKFGQAYDIVDLDYFGEDWKEYHAYFDIGPREKGKIGACLSCHSLGLGLSSGDFTNYSAGELAPNQLDSDDFKLTHWMPPGAQKETWKKDYDTSVSALAACNKDSKSCKSVPLH
jgi:hypothetical protein